MIGRRWLAVRVKILEWRKQGDLRGDPILLLCGKLWEGSKTTCSSVKGYCICIRGIVGLRPIVWMIRHLMVV
jgi:hypothetical protein